ncbi:MAG: bacteriohemerythrin [Desulfobacter sp.]|nr:MAG: bacteriohemerythrin [Desulfobacter sp.]
MESFVWGEHFITGLGEVDKQHRHLIDVLNRFGTALAENKVLDGHVKRIFDELADYALYHFKAEERLMAEMKMDSRHIVQHSAEHSNFVGDVQALIREITPGNPETTQALLAFLIQWVAYHILGSDQKTARQIAQIKKGKTPREAFLLEEKRERAPTEALLTALNNLYTQVARRNRQLIEFNLSLEEKIADRTRELVEANRHLETLALTDTLTGLGNRRFAMDQLQRLWESAREKGRPLSCMMIDADEFKPINDRFGHDAGDIVLARLAKELEYSVRNDDLVCRLGGDEFFIICADTSLKGAMHLAEAIRANVAALRVAAGDGQWRGSVSIGVAWNHPELKRTDEMIKAADQGVYMAKDSGRNAVETVQAD